MLTTNRVTYGDAGQYKCSAKNSEGENEAAFHITVTGKCRLTFLFQFLFSFSSFFFMLSPFLNCTFEFYVQVLLKLILSSRISRLPITRLLSSFALWAVSLHLRYFGLRMGSIAVTRTLSQSIEWVMKMLVNINAALKTVKGKVNQLFILQSQVNVDLILFPSVALLIFWRFFFFFFHTFTFFELYFWILCPGPPEINTELKNQSVAYNSSLKFICSLSGFPTPEILWTKDGVNCGNNNTLTIRQARLKDSGSYTCSANNSEGSKNSTFWIQVAGGTVLIYT